MTLLLLPLAFIAAADSEALYLSGRLSDSAWAARAARYGPDLGVPIRLPVPESHTCAIAGDLLVVGGHNRVHLFDVADPRQPREVGVSPEFGHVRHLVVHDDLVYVASRADGLFILDIGEPTAPKVVGSYDPVEFATALAISGDVLFVACRNFGVELIDIRYPRRLRHLAIVRTGEAQGLAVRDGIAYVGVWGSRELVVVDARNPRRPAITAKLPLDGFGNGVAIAGDRVLVACGHHARGMKQNDPGDPAYGRGHGLEVFRLTDPLHPEPETVLKSMPNYRLGPDAWAVATAGGEAFVADGLSGLYRVSLEGEPRHTGQALLPFVEARQQYDYAHDVAVGAGMVWVSGAFGGVYGYALPNVTTPASQVGEPLEVDDSFVFPDIADDWRMWGTNNPVHKVAVQGDLALLAVGRGGIHLLRLWPEIEEIEYEPTAGVVYDVRWQGDLAVTAEGPAGLRLWRVGVLPITPVARPLPGLNIWRLDQRSLTALATYQTTGPIRGVVLTPTGHALLHVGDANFEILDITDPSRPRRVYACGSEGRGLLYGDQISDELVAGRYACVAWHVKPPALFDLSVDPPVPAGELNLSRRGWRGIAGTPTGALAVVGGGLMPLTVGGPESEPVTDPAGGWFEGRAVLVGEQLLVWRRHDGRVWVLDVSAPDHPKVIEAFDLPGNPGRPQVTSQGLVIPCGHAGVLIKDASPER